MSYQTGNCDAPAEPRRASKRRIQHRFIIEKRVNPEHVCCTYPCSPIEQMLHGLRPKHCGYEWWRAGAARSAEEAERWIDHDQRHFGAAVRLRRDSRYEYRVIDTHAR